MLLIAWPMAAQASGRLMAEVFSDHAVLQRNRPIPVWGHASPNAVITLRMDQQVVHARADRTGRWKTTLRASPAGGPFVLEAQSGTQLQQVKDVLVGDVWLCSGQSNMELPVERSLDARAEIAAAGNDRIRLLRVPKASNAVPQHSLAQPAQWRASAPDSVREFSAACFYFARELQKSVDVPMGLISASWNGSRIQSWISEATMRKGPGHDQVLDTLDLYAKDQAAGLAQWGMLWERQWRKDHDASIEPPWQPDAAGQWTQAHSSLRWLVPELADYVGQAWYRSTIELDASQAAQAATLDLGQVDELDLTWINGHVIGSTFGTDLTRRYPVPAGVLHAGRNALVLNVLNTYRQGGLAGPPLSRALVLSDGTRLALDAHWQYTKLANDQEMAPAAPWMSSWGTSTLYNGMIAPLAGYGLRGILWYQGESNTFEAPAYGELLGQYRNDVRESFGADLSLLMVQLASFGRPPTSPEASAWAQLREAQRVLVAADPQAALAVAIDIGERNDLHPANKQELGRRLARAAGHLIYGQNLSASGPTPLRAWRDNNRVLVEFDGLNGSLVAYGGAMPLGFELCGKDQSSCRYATASIQGRLAVIQAEGLDEATRVGYGWADNPVTNLYDESGLPAVPFELPIR